MPFIQVARSLDDLLYEVMTWLLFYPATLWRSIRSPLGTMNYARQELGKPAEAQFRETLRPPTFLLVTVMLAYVVELAAVGESVVVSNRDGVANLIDDDESMMVSRIVAFALFPVIMAAIATALEGQPVNRETLRRPFYEQCFLAAPFVLLLCLFGTAVRRPEPWLEPAALVAGAVTTLVYVGMEAEWLTRTTGSGRLRAVAGAVAGVASCMTLLALLAWLFGGE